MVEVANGRSLVWGAEAVQALRERLGVGGRTVGALPRGPRQNSRLGLPLLLMPEEARLLAEIGAVTLVSAPRPDPRRHSLVRGRAAVRTPWTGAGGVMWEWATGISGFGALRLGGLGESGFLASWGGGVGGKAYLDPEVAAEFTSQALASFKRQQEQGFQEQSALAAEARETRRQGLLEKIAEGQAAKRQKLEQDSGASESQEAGENQAAAQKEAGSSQASGEQEEAGERGSGARDLGEEWTDLRGILAGTLGLGDGKTFRLGFTKLWGSPPQAPPVPNQGLQRGWPPCPGLPCSSS